MKRALSLLCFTTLLLSMLVGCADSTDKRFQYTYTDLFDTVTTFVLYTTEEKQANTWAAALYARLAHLHALYSIYEPMDGGNNLKTVNDHAGQPVVVEPELFSMLQFCIEVHALTASKVNVAMGGVLQLWHDAREKGLEDPETAWLPDATALKTAAEHSDITDVVLDAGKQTVQLVDPEMTLDVGAVAKGYAAEQLADYARELGITSAILSIGGNVVTVGSKQHGAPFVIGIEKADDPAAYAQTVHVRDLAVVTSGDYQRYYTVDGVRYAHLIDPDTLYPARYAAAVTVVGKHSGLADALSTALFLLPPSEGDALLQTMPGYAAFWQFSDGTTRYSADFAAYTAENEKVGDTTL